MRIRELQEGEWPLWRDLAIAAATDSPDAFRPTVEDHLASTDEMWIDLIESTVKHPRGGLWIAEAGDDAVGMLFARVDASYEVAEVGAMWVAPDNRDAGVGSELLAAAMHWAISQGAHVMELWVTEGNSAAVSLYNRKGFTDTEETQFLRDGCPLIVRKMRVSLTT